MIQTCGIQSCSAYSHGHCVILDPLADREFPELSQFPDIWPMILRLLPALGKLARDPF